MEKNTTTLGQLSDLDQFHGNMISTNRPPVPQSRVGWLQPSTDEHFPELNENCFWKRQRVQPTRLCDTAGGLIVNNGSKFFFEKLNIIRI